MSAADCADAFITAWVSRFGLPAYLASARGAQFTESVWPALCIKLGASHQITTAYHPQSNCMVEQVQRQLKGVLHSCLAGVEWPQHLPWVLFGVLGLPLRKTYGFLQRSWLMARPSPYLASSSLLRSHHQLLLWSDTVRISAAADLAAYL
jgi:hypothetical protein